LTGYGPCSIYIHHDPMLTETIPQTTWRVERLACHEIVLKERPKCLHGRLIKRSKKARERRARGQAMATKKRHKDFAKGQESLIKGFEGGFTTQRVADEHHGKIDEIVATKARSGKPYVFLKGFEDTSMREAMRHRPHFSHPGRG
jgi:hypothetical protein